MTCATNRPLISHNVDASHCRRFNSILLQVFADTFVTIGAEHGSTLTCTGSHDLAHKIHHATYLRALDRLEARLYSAGCGPFAVHLKSLLRHVQPQPIPMRGSNYCYRTIANTTATLAVLTKS
jgi:hypothetical protein